MKELQHLALVQHNSQLDFHNKTFYQVSEADLKAS